MGDERRDFDTPGRTNGQQDQTEPVPLRDETQPFAAPDENQASGAADETRTMAAPDATQPITAPDETQPFAAQDGAQPMGTPDRTQPIAAPDETQPFAAQDGAQPMGTPDRTQPFTPAGEPDHTTVMPSKGAWSGRAGVSPPQGPSLRDSVPYTQQIPQTQQPRPWWTPVLLGVLALGLLGILILVAWWMGRDNSPVPVDTSTPSAVLPTETIEPTPPPTTAFASPTAQLVTIPRLVGLDLNDAVAQLDQLGLSYRFEYRQSDEPQERVIEASPPEGIVVPIQTTVTLVISTGRERSPTPSPTPAVASASPN